VPRGAVVPVERGIAVTGDGPDGKAESGEAVAGAAAGLAGAARDENGHGFTLVRPVDDENACHAH
jgi:hypothetical protein